VVAESVKNCGLVDQGLISSMGSGTPPPTSTVQNTVGVRGVKLTEA
jgi:hypothetical protein